MGAHYVNVAPRYTCGSPAAVDIDIAERLAKDERESYEFIIEGREGQERAAKAKAEGLKLIVFEMVEHSKQWLVFDWLTNELHVWPFHEKCPKCKKRFSCTRGWINEHGCPFRFEGYVGHLMNENERIKYARRFFKQPDGT